MGDIEKNKWLVSRIDAIHDYLFERIQISLKNINDEIHSYNSNLTVKRNSVLTALGVALSITLGIQAIDQIDNSLFYSILTAIIIIGLIDVMIVHYIKTAIEKIIGHVGTEYYINQYQIDFSKGHFLHMTNDLSALDIEFLENYFKFINLLEGMMSLPVLMAYLEESKRRVLFIFPAIKNVLKHDFIEMYNF